MGVKNDSPRRTERKKRENHRASLYAAAGAAAGSEAKRTPEEASRKPVVTAFTLEDVEWVQNMILSEVGEEYPMTIQKIVAMCREPGVFEYPIDGRQIALMARAGYLRRRGSDVWVESECERRAA